MTNTEESSELRTAALQPRAQARVATIREAAVAHYAEVGRDRFNTADVAKAAGCSIGTIYRYFPDRVALMDYIHPDRDEPNVVTLDAPLPDKPEKPQTIEIIKEVVPEDLQKMTDSAVKTLQELRAWAERLSEKGEGQGDLQVAGQALIKIMSDRNW